jgi:hypothetical protein
LVGLRDPSVNSRVVFEPPYSSSAIRVYFIFNFLFR